MNFFRHPLRLALALAALAAISSTSIAFYPYTRDFFADFAVRRLIEPSYNASRPGGGRLFGAAYYAAGSTSASSSDLSRAQVLLLTAPQSDSRFQLQGMLYLAADDWQSFVRLAGQLPVKVRQTPETLNNIGVSYLALSESNPAYLLNALDAFQEAVKSGPRAPEPLFNLVITYRKLRLYGPANEALHQYDLLDASSPWARELRSSQETVDSNTLARFRTAVEKGNVPEAERLFGKNPELYRKVAMQYGLFNASESSRVVQFIGMQFERRFGDKTISALLAPLSAKQRDSTIALRDFVTQGARLYLEGNLAGSLEEYSKAEKLRAGMDSPFDGLWIDVNRADTEIRAGKFDDARERLERLVSTAREHQYLWLAAKGLTVYGATLKLTETYAKLMETLETANRMFIDIGASSDRVRPLYYLAGYRYAAGDSDGALALALECLRLTDDDDSVRISSLFFRIGADLYRRGLTSQATRFAIAAVEAAKKTNNPGLEATATSNLAELYESLGQSAQAEKYLKDADAAFSRIASNVERTRTGFSLDVVKAKTYLNRKKYQEAQTLLESDLAAYAQLPFRAGNVHSSYLMLLARLYSETGHLQEAALKFREAIDVVENDDQYLVSEKFRVKFDDARRELYDSAIDFEYSNGSTDAAWAYLQKYRAKLFLEFMAQFNPGIEQTHQNVLHRSEIQSRLPKDIQVVEYLLLKDRLLIWLVSDKLFTLRSVPIPRAELEGKVQEVLHKLRGREEAGDLLNDLGKVLIEPVANLLDPNRTVAIVPDRALHGLPFGSLRQPGKSQYLLQDFPIMVSPSLTHLLATNAAAPRRDTIVGFGSQNGDLSEIKELAALTGIYSRVTTFSGATVDKTRFLDAMHAAPVFHYAGHSATDAVDPLRSVILLGGDRSGSNSVTAVDIAAERLAGNAVVILSSCDSSVGNSRDGVGMRGLTSAFLIGGAGSVVGSLWPVEASSTSDLMIRFHRSFANARMPVAKALREAQLALLRESPERSHPYFWSGFEVTGNFSALR